MKASTDKPAVYKFSKNSGVAKMKELLKFAAWLGNKLGFSVESDAFDYVRARGNHLTLGMAAAGEAASTEPFFVNATGGIVAGTLIGVVPTISGTPIDSLPAPVLALSGTGTEYVVATVTSTPDITTLAGRDFHHPLLSSVSIALSVTGTVPTLADMQSDSGTFIIGIATFVDGVKTSQWFTGSKTGLVQDALDGSGIGQLVLSAI